MGRKFSSPCASTNLRLVEGLERLALGWLVLGWLLLPLLLVLAAWGVAMDCAVTSVDAASDSAPERSPQMDSYAARTTPQAHTRLHSKCTAYTWQGGLASLFEGGSRRIHRKEKPLGRMIFPVVFHPPRR